MMSLTDLAHALVAARVVDNDAVFDPDGYDGGGTLERIRAAHERLVPLFAKTPAPSAARTDKECLPVAWRYRTEESGEKWLLSHMSPTQVREWNDFTESSPLYATPPDHREAMRLALEALEICADETSSGLPLPAIDALRAALGEDK